MKKLYLYISFMVPLIVISYFTGLSDGKSSEKNKQNSEYIKQIKIYDNLNKVLTDLSIKHYDLYQEAVNRPPTVVTDRVYVKAICPTEDPSGSLGDRSLGTRAELHSEVVRRITKVTDEAERDVLRCLAARNSLQAKIKRINNE